jgi:hypothetical protein
MSSEARFLPPEVRSQIIEALAADMSRIPFLKAVITEQSAHIRDLAHRLALTERQLADALDAKGER